MIVELTENGTAYLSWLASASISSNVYIQIINRFRSPENCYRAFFSAPDRFSDLVSPARISILRKRGADSIMDFFRDVTMKEKIQALQITDADYPAVLRNIQDPPPILFYKGDTGCLSGRTVSMVGSRAASYDGQKAARRIARDLSSNGISIISGLASGIDTSAHLGCLEGGSPTAAVMACGLDRVYPSCNQKLSDDILSGGGLLISEFAPGEKPEGWHFPVRNRIMTGLSQALILMEARIRSGSMTSVQHALDQGKDVFVYPGDPASEKYEANHQLLREGALYFTSAEDILEDMGWLDNRRHIGQNIVCSSENIPENPGEKAVFLALKPGKLGFEELLSATGLDASVLMSCLTIMQIRGMIESLPGKTYQLKS